MKMVIPLKLLIMILLKGVRPRRQAFGYDVEQTLDSMHFLKELIDILNDLGLDDTRCGR